MDSKNKNVQKPFDPTVISHGGWGALEGRPAVFFDRDGIANVSPGPGYVTSVADFHVRPEFVEAVAVATEKGWPCLIVSNQRGVGKGLVPPEELEAMHKVLRKTLAARGLALLDILAYVGLDSEHPDCKPHPGLLRRAAALHGLDLARSWMIGDRERDVQTGINAGVAVTVRVDDDGTDAPPEAALASAATYRLARLADLPELLRRSLFHADDA